MREIKFRIPHFDDSRKFDGFLEMEFNPQGKNGWGGSAVTRGKLGEPQQYTGLKDKNGKEIYEGDIISFKFWNKSGMGKIEIRDGAFGYSYDCEIVDNIFRAFCDWDEPEIDCYPFIDVIGNIYETAHLLNNEQNVQVSDTTEADSSNDDGNKIILNKLAE